MKHLATKREVAAYEHSVKGGLAAHAARLECLEAQLQQAGSFLDTLPQSRQELGAALAEMQQRRAAEQAKCDEQMSSRLVEIEVGGLLRAGDAAALAELRARVAKLHVPRQEVESLREAALGVRDGLLGRTDALGAEVAALRAEQEASLASLQKLAAAAECKVDASTAKVEAQCAEMASLHDAVQERVGTCCDLDDLDEVRTRYAFDRAEMRKAWQLKLSARQHRLEVSGAALLADHEKMQLQAPSRAEVESLAAQAEQLTRTLEALESALPLKAEERRVQRAVGKLQLEHHQLQTGLQSKAGAKEVAERHRRLVVKAQGALGMLEELGTRLSTTVEAVKGGLETAEGRVATKLEGVELQPVTIAQRQTQVQVEELCNEVVAVAPQAQGVGSGEIAPSLDRAATHAMKPGFGRKPRVIPSCWAAAASEIEAELTQKRTAAAAAAAAAAAVSGQKARRQAELIRRIEEVEIALLQVQLLVPTTSLQFISSARA